MSQRIFAIPNYYCPECMEMLEPISERAQWATGLLTLKHSEHAQCSMQLDGKPTIYVVELTPTFSVPQYTRVAE